YRATAAPCSAQIPKETAEVRRSDRARLQASSAAPHETCSASAAPDTSQNPRCSSSACRYSDPKQSTRCATRKIQTASASANLLPGPKSDGDAGDGPPTRARPFRPT